MCPSYLTPSPLLPLLPSPSLPHYLNKNFASQPIYKCSSPLSTETISLAIHTYMYEFFLQLHMSSFSSYIWVLSPATYGFFLQLHMGSFSKSVIHIWSKTKPHN